ncbi:type I-U CRISPR-associated protein Cas7 [Candidatus Methylacidiphilum fumarolicum]|uniref:Uncharacterized protein n=2 Tax=Candidatus Methylacidiphilum fumarolicum TaxID=591154 RepID=I0K1I2_METFB|nr:type I-U CRISPR-associated RAMP protein Csb1/Cas7u [Candidatus Methylacidiphilum fumarolicum]MBW6415918.1 type I-U CRISPR-associated protein Cas7 [Candidatus Methylacidiphilum fumarolicum]TFE66679.1 type I-U CRISPR-associated protein Cas7 [Candidatus Methylacidiphilum fumarolicum]TFE72550.1 type I-U CRISPR-associated protein Cas7 [Candidatus Methylacidiphilum fumarolicum]TFE74338.1 type I-U CRISPR-associated protein Cas7 [Candidatus Methylacidiphilum fumarolicum]TFE75687.1 type I-U CRISPR-a
MNASNVRNVSVEEMENWITDENVIAVVVEEQLEPAGGWRFPVKPPTFGALDEEETTPPYCIDELPDGHNVCILDTPASANNRREPIFLREEFKDLVPKIQIIINEKKKSLLELPHRAADVMIKCSKGHSKIAEALSKYLNGNAWPLAEIAPTTLVFGAWDSRGENSNLKISGVLRSCTLAYDVKPIHMPFQYVPPVDYKSEIFGADKPQKKLSEMGFDGALGVGWGGRNDWWWNMHANRSKPLRFAGIWHSRGRR